MKELYCSFNQQWVNKTLIRKKNEEEYDRQFEKAGLVYDGKRYPTLGAMDGKSYHPVNMGWKWVNGSTDLDGLFTMLVHGGFSVSTWVKGTHRNSANFIKSNVAMVDIDSGSTIDDIKQHEFYNEFGSGFYTSPSHTEEAHRLRLIFILERVITNEKEMRAILTALIDIFGGDSACKDATRLFYGSKGAQHEMIEGKCISNDVIDILIEAGTPALITLYEWVDEGEVTDVERQYVVDQLSMTFLGEYDKWFSVCAAMQNSGYTVQEFIRASVGGMMQQKTVRDCEELWQDISKSTPAERPATMGTIWKLIGGVKKYREWLSKELEKAKEELNNG